jgi:hypothetical protein
LLYRVGLPTEYQWRECALVAFLGFGKFRSPPLCHCQWLAAHQLTTAPNEDGESSVKIWDSHLLDLALHIELLILCAFFCTFCGAFVFRVHYGPLICNLMYYRDHVWCVPVPLSTEFKWHQSMDLPLNPYPSLLLLVDLYPVISHLDLGTEYIYTVLKYKMGVTRYA